MVSRPETLDAVKEALTRRGRTVVAVQGRSMFPTLKHGTRVEVHPVAFDELRIGDLVVFSNGRTLICHRLIRKTRRLCFLKGDTNLWTDPPVIWGQVLGRVTRVIHEDLRIQSIDAPHQRLLAALLAHLSYPYAIYYNALHYFGACRWWAKGIHME